MKIVNFSSLIIIASFLSACGSSGKDTTPPIINLLGSNPVVVSAGSDYAELGAKATDNIDGEITVAISGSVNTEKLGTYSLTYTAMDVAGNKATATRVINVIDKTPPKLTLLGKNPTEQNIGASYVEAGARAIDEIDGEINVGISGTVDTGKEGSYVITYSAIDKAGNGNQITRTVNVLPTEAAVAGSSIQVLIETGATIDIALVEQSLEKLEPGLDLDVTLRNKTAIWRRAYRELTPKSSLCGNEGKSYLDDVIAGLEIEFSVNGDGVISARTISDNASSHLVVLSTPPEWSGTHSFEKNYTDFSGNRLPWGSFGDPASGYTSELKHSNRLSGWLQNLYGSLHNSGITLNGPQDNSAFFGLPHVLSNEFDKPITMVRSYLRHQQMDYSWYNELGRTYDQFYNEQWSPIANVPDQNASLGRNFDLSYNGATDGLMTLHSYTDNRNSGVVTAEGFVNMTPFSSSGSVSSNKRWSASCTSSSCVISNNYCSGVLLHLAGAYPLSINMKGYSAWSWTGMAAEVAVFGDVKTSNHNESPASGDDNNPAPLRFVIPPAQL